MGMGKKIGLILIILGLGMVVIPSLSHAQGAEAFNNSGLPIPRFVSLRGDKVFLRTGPALRYPIKWIFVRNGLPVEIIQEFDTWRKIRDINGDEGWIHLSLLSGKRNVIVSAEEGVTLLRQPEENSKLVARLEKDVQAALEECQESWCKITAGSFSGWTQRKSLWGVYEAEELD